MTVDAALTPAPDVLTADVAIHDVTIKLHADFKVACIGGIEELHRTHHFEVH